MLDVIEVSERVEKGAEFLDQVEPQWLEDIDLATLLVASGESCILGQLHGEFSEGVDVLLDGDYQEAVRLGFDIDMTDAWEDWGMLQSAWVGLIIVRQSRAKAGA